MSFANAFDEEDRIYHVRALANAAAVREILAPERWDA
jgi:hypothetical protein